MAPPIVRDVALTLPRGGVGFVTDPVNVGEALVSCWTGRHAEECTVVADYGRTPAYGSTTAPTVPGAFHRLRLGSLLPGATVHFRLRATQTGGARETATTQEYRFTQPTAPIPLEPVVSGITVDQVTPSGARVSWTTADADPAGQVNYGPTEALGSFAPETGAQLRTAHSVTLAGLTPETEYHYRIFQPGWAGNSRLTDPATFTTAAPPLPQEPEPDEAP